MTIEKAKNLKIGQIVTCPSDRGDSGYMGRIIHISETVNSNIYGNEYLWVTVKRNGHNDAHVWPSNRL